MNKPNSEAQAGRYLLPTPPQESVYFVQNGDGSVKPVTRTPEQLAIAERIEAFKHALKLCDIPTTQAELRQPGLYLRLFHGFECAEDRRVFDDWGADGPIIGPLEYAHTTYATDLNVSFAEGHEGAHAHYFGRFDEDLPLRIEDECVRYLGWRFGDYGAFYFDGKRDAP